MKRVLFFFHRDDDYYYKKILYVLMMVGERMHLLISRMGVGPIVEGLPTAP